MIDKFSALKEWFAEPLGMTVLTAMQEQLATFLTDLYFPRILQLGSIRSLSAEESNNFSQKHIVAPYKDPKVEVIANYELLPFENNIFNLVFLPLILELYVDIDALIQEIDRVLLAEGYILICGINPGSFWGLAKLLKQQQVFPITNINLRTSLSLRNLLVNKGYEICKIHSFFYRMPMTSASTLENTLFLENMGKMLWPYPGGIYLLLAQKKESQLLSIRPLWHFRHYVFGKEFAEPSARGSGF